MEMKPTWIYWYVRDTLVEEFTEFTHEDLELTLRLYKRRGWSSDFFQDLRALRDAEPLQPLSALLHIYAATLDL